MEPNKTLFETRENLFYEDYIRPICQSESFGQLIGPETIYESLSNTRNQVANKLV
jgi:hypothetical protein